MVDQYLNDITGSGDYLGKKYVEEAKLWLGTPYIHQASVRGIGADCLGLLRGIYRNVYGYEPVLNIPNYTPDWSEVSGEETIYNEACKHLALLKDKSSMHPGDILLFRMNSGSISKHLGILLDDGYFIHAYSGRGVVKNRLGHYWMQKLSAVFRFPQE